MGWVLLRIALWCLVTDNISIDRVRTDSEYDFINLHNSVNGNNGNDDELFDDSPFGDLNSTCEYFTPEQFCETIDPTDRHLSSFCINCQSINAHWDGFQNLMLGLSTEEFHFDIIGITEIFKIHNNINYNIEGYHTLQFNTRPPNSDGRGGVGLYINNDLQFEKRTDLSVFIEHVFESIFVEIRTKAKETLIIGIIYRPKHST